MEIWERKGRDDLDCSVLRKILAVTGVVAAILAVLYWNSIGPRDLTNMDPNDRKPISWYPVP